MDNIEQRKKIANILKRAKNTAKPDKCIVCGEAQTSFCNSHLIPQMILKTIAEDGKLLHSNALVGVEVLDIEKGINNAGTFHFICRKCDGILFQDYENRDALINYPSDNMLAEIAMKNMLLMLSKRGEEKEIFNIIQRESNVFENKEILDEVQGLDTKEYLEDFRFYKEISDEKKSGCFQILYWKKLPYVTPVAAQSPIAIYKDMNGDIVNDVYSEDPNYRIQNVHLCIFPIENETVVLLFCHRKEKNYKKLRHQLNSISEEKKFMYINYIMFAYTENYFFSKRIQEKIETDENLKKLSRELNGLPNFGYMDIDSILEEYEPVKMEEIPNFLSEKYSLQGE